MIDSYDKFLNVSGIFQYCKVFLVYFLTANLVRNNDDVKLVIRVLLVSLIFESLIYFLLTITGMGGGQEGVLLRSRGTLETTGVIGAYFASLLLVSSWAILGRKVFSAGLLAPLAFLMSGVSLVLTLNRASWIDCSFCVLVSLFYGWRRRWVRVGGLMGVLVAIGIVVVIFWGIISFRLSENSNQALTVRTNLMVVAWRIIKANPITGVGINNYYDVYRKYVPDEFAGLWIRPAHNEYLIVWAETGTVGFSMFAWLLLATLGKGIHCIRAKDNTLAPLSLGIVAGFLVMLLDMNWNIFGSEQVNYYIWFLIGIIAAMDRIVRLDASSKTGYLRVN